MEMRADVGDGARSRRGSVAVSLAMLAALVFATTAKGDDAGWAALRSGAILLVRHANAPGFGDPAGFRLGDCSTQRNLDSIGRAQARRLGDLFREKGIEPAGVLSSQWCRSHETAALAFPGQVRSEAAFNSFFERPDERTRRTAAARRILSEWSGPGPLVVVTHHVNIEALTGIAAASGEGVVVRFEEGRARVVGRIQP